MRPPVLALLVSGAVACIPTDESPPTGSAEFGFAPSKQTSEGVSDRETLDDYAIHFDRILLGFKTTTIGKIGVDSACAYRGRGERSDVVIDPRRGVTQTFNGIQEGDCPDVGVIFGPPGDATTLGDGVSADDLVSLATPTPAHAIVEATATSAPREDRRPTRLRILLRFTTALTGARFGGCHTDERGVQVLGGERRSAKFVFAAENLFREAVSTSAPLRVIPFADADLDEDGIVTMDELDAYPLADIRAGVYETIDGTHTNAFLGGYLRDLFRFTVLFDDEDGFCIGNAPDSDSAP